MEEEKIIPIKVQVDNSDAEKSLKDIEKQSIKRSKTVSKQTRDIANQMKNAFKNVNISGLTKQMNAIKQTVSKTMKQVKAEIKGTSFTPDISNLQGMQNALGTSKLKEDAVALGNALAQVQQKANQAGVSLTSLNGLQQLNNILASSSTKLTNTQRGAMMRFASDAIVELGQVNTQQGKLATGIGKVVTSYKTYAPKIQSYIDKIKTKTSQWLSSHNKASKGIDSANKKLSSSFKSLLSAMMPFLSIYAVFSGLKNSINNVMESIETDNMFNTVFGPSAKQMNDWVKEVNQTLGLGITDTKKYTATINQMGRAMGLTGTQAMDMSQKMALMAGDISSFYDTDIANVQADLRSALSGSFETMDKYGIVLRATTIQQFAYANGIAKTGAELNNAQRAMATTMMIEQQLGLANGDLARSINSPANQARILRSNLTDLSVALGKCFMPIVTVVLPILNTFVASLTTTINAIANFISQVFALFGVQVDFGGVGGAVDDMASSIESADVGSGDLSDNLASGADSAKEIQKSLSGIDELNILSDNSSSSGSGSSSSGSTGSGVGTGGIDTSAIDSGLAQTETKFSQWATKVANALQSVWSSLKGGWNSVGDYINTSLDNLKQSFSNLGTSIESFLIGCWNNGGEELIYNVGRLAGAFTGLALDVGGQVVNAISKLFDHMNPEKNTNTRKFIEAMNNALKACQDFALSAGGWLKKFMNSGGQAFLNNIGDIAVTVGTILVDAFGRGVKLVKDFMNSWVGQAIIEGFAKTLEWVSEVLEAMLGWIRDNQTWLEALLLAVAGGVGTFKLISGAIKTFNGIMTICSGIMAILSSAGTILAGVIAFITSPIGLVVLAIGAVIAIGYLLWDNWDWLCEKAGQLGEWISKKWSELKDAVVKKTKEIVDGVKQWWSDLVTNTKTKFNDIKTAITSKFSEIYKSVKTKVTELYTSITTKFNEIKTNVTNKVTEIKTSITTKMTEISTSISTTWNTIKTNVTNKVTEIKTNVVNKWNEIKTSISDKVTGIKTNISTTFSNVLTNVTTTFSNIKTKITDPINTAKSTISTYVSNIKSYLGFNGLATTVGNTFNSVKTKINTAMEGAKTVVNNAVSKLKSAFNFSWSLPNLKLPHISVSGGVAPYGIAGKGKLPSFSIKWYRNGGILPAGSNSIFGMNGNALMAGGELSTGGEAILPLSDLFNEMRGMFDTQNRQLISALANNNQPINLALYLDGDTLAKRQFKKFKELARLGILDFSELV